MCVGGGEQLQLTVHWRTFPKPTSGAESGAPAPPTKLEPPDPDSLSSFTSLNSDTLSYKG